MAVRYVELHRVSMAISKDEFRRIKEGDGELTIYEEGTNPHTILEFLATHQDKAFPPSEIANQTGIPASSVRVTLTRLEDTGLVDHADKYWSINEYELGSQRAALLSQQSIDTDQYAGFDKEEEKANAELPPERQPRDE